MAVYQEHFHPVPRSTAAEPSDAPSSSVPRTSGAAALGILYKFLSRRLQTRDSCSLGLDSAGPEMSEKASFGKEHRVLQFILLSTNKIISPKAAVVAKQATTNLCGELSLK